MHVNTSPISQQVGAATSAARMSALGAASLDTAPRSVIRGQLKTFPSFSTKNIYTQCAALDWLTLTTWDEEAFHTAAGLFQSCLTTLDVKKWMQYEGSGGDGFFFGMALQNGRKHYALRISGSVAHDWCTEVLRLFPDLLARFKCTRVDVQFTSLEVPAGDELAATKDRLRSASWGRPGPRSRVDMYDNDDGLHTLYIGSRESVRMQRIYVKPVADNNMLRWEVEYKGQLAEKLLHAIQEGGLLVLAGILAGEIEAVPLADEDAALVALRAALSVPAERLRVTRDTSDEWTAARWLHSSVLPCLRRLAGSDEAIRFVVADFLHHSAQYLGDALRPDVIQVPRAVSS